MGWWRTFRSCLNEMHPENPMHETDQPKGVPAHGRVCETCQRPIHPRHPFTTCPQCLLAEALEEGQEMDAAPGCPGGQVREFFEKYELVRRRSAGGQGEVFEAWDHHLRRLVAMKRLAPELIESKPARARFIAEAQIASQLEHPGILPIHDVGTDPDGRPYFTTALLPGTTLADILHALWHETDPDWSRDRMIELLVRVCEIVAFAHSKGVIHRDLKPGNILVGRFGEVYVIDWGSAHVMRDARAAFAEASRRFGQSIIDTDRDRAIARDLVSALATAAAGHPITTLFTAPEILRGELDRLGPRTDVYSLGVILYELTAGRPPYSRDDGTIPPDLEQLILAGPPISIRRIRRNASKDLAAICERAMATAEGERYPDALGLAADLRNLLEIRPVQARRRTLVVRLDKWVRRNSVGVALGCLGVTLVAASSSLALRWKWQKDQARQATSLREASLAARSGQWQLVLERLAEAESAGFPDRIELALQRTEAWLALGRTEVATAEMKTLLSRRDLGRHQGAVLLRAGEFDLFEPGTQQRGLDRLRAALGVGLNPADAAFAAGLLAETTPAALDHLYRARQLDPYHRGAHRASLGLELLLGRWNELESHLRVFRVLFPDDPSPGAIEATRLAVNGKLSEAKAVLDSRSDNQDARATRVLSASLPLLAAAATHFDLDVMLGDRPADQPPVHELVAAAIPLLLGEKSAGAAHGTRFAQLPCVKSGLEKGLRAIQSLVLPFGGGTEAALGRVREAFRSHPEALIPLAAATLLPEPDRSDTRRRRAFLENQIELCEMAMNAPSVLPNIHRLPQFLAVQSRFELLQKHDPRNQELHRTCVDSLRAACGSETLGPKACQAYFRVAMGLHAMETAREISNRWRQVDPGSRECLEAQVQVALVTGAYGTALPILDQMLAKNPLDAWANARRRDVTLDLEKLRQRTDPAR